MTAKRRVLRIVKNTQHVETGNLSLPLAAQHPKRKRSNQPVLSAVQKEGTMKLIQVMGKNNAGTTRISE